LYAFLKECGAFIEVAETWLVSRTLHALGFTKKKVIQVRAKRNPHQRMDWWERVPPFNVMGTPTSKIQTKRE
jgi:transposase